MVVQSYVWLLSREAPANEIIGAYTSRDRAFSAADSYEPGVYWTEVWPDDYRSGLWRLARLIVDPEDYAHEA